MTDSAAAAAAITATHRSEWARVLATTVRLTRDLDLAEECVQDAYASALDRWVTGGIPQNPGAWPATTARRHAIDAIRHDKALRSRLPLLVEPDEETREGVPSEWAHKDAAEPEYSVPVVRLNRTVALAMVAGPEAALAEIQGLDQSHR